MDMGEYEPARAELATAELQQQIATSIAAVICDGINRTIPLNVKLWTAEHIAAYLNRTVSQTRQAILCLPDFPRPFRLPVANGTQRAHPLYKAMEVIDWVEKYRDNAELPRLRSRKP